MTHPVATEWIRPVVAPTLRPTEVHVWRGQTPASNRAAADALHLLDAAERARADRFHFDRDRCRFVLSHAMLRTVLAQYAGLLASELRFATQHAGKPVLVGAQGRSLEFNLSHSGMMTLVAVSCSGAVGIDVEEWSSTVEVDDVARHFFSASECRELDQLGGDAKRRAFFACWSRKEAYIKATGLGVTAGLDYFDVVVDAARPARLLADRRHPGATKSWQLADVDVGEGYAAAIVTAVDASIRCFVLDPVDRRPFPGES